jgi:hypothetical protein
VAITEVATTEVAITEMAIMEAAVTADRAVKVAAVVEGAATPIKRWSR